MNACPCRFASPSSSKSMLQDRGCATTLTGCGEPAPMASVSHTMSSMANPLLCNSSIWKTSSSQAAFRRSTSSARRASFVSVSVTASPFPAATTALSVFLFSATVSNSSRQTFSRSGANGAFWQARAHPPQASPCSVAPTQETTKRYWDAGRTFSPRKLAVSI